MTERTRGKHWLLAPSSLEGTDRGTMEARGRKPQQGRLADLTGHSQCRPCRASLSMPQRALETHSRSSAGAEMERKTAGKVRSRELLFYCIDLFERQRDTKRMPFH